MNTLQFISSLVNSFVRLNFNFIRPTVLLAVIVCFVLMPFLLEGADYDQDGIDDQYEAQLLDTYAPVVLLHLSENRLPANVNWYLQRGWLRFHHGGGCDDCEIIPGPGHPEPHPNQSSLIQQGHPKKHPLLYWPPWDACEHYNHWEYSDIDYDSGQCFFVQVSNDSHYGASNSNDWKVYGHVYPNTFGGINVQYWFFYSYNEGPLGQNHEGDWECVMVQLKADTSVKNVIYYAHGEPYGYTAEAVTWYDSTHPVVISALGSHASYHNMDEVPWWERGSYWCTPVELCQGAWFTWTGGKPLGSPGYQGGGVINVGEKVDNAARVLNSQVFIHYSGKWGEIGNPQPWQDDFSGPRGPAYQSNWNENRVISSNADFTYVDDDFNSSTPGWGYDHFNRLYDGIFHIKSSGTVLVYSGTYYEKVLIQKPLYMIGVDGKEVTFIDGQNQTGSPVLWLKSDNIEISGFTIQNGSVGVSFDPMVASDGVFTENTIKNFTWGLYIWPGNANNLVYHNNFINNVIHAETQEAIANTWDINEDPASGNYWDDYTGSDNNGDGIGDTPRVIRGNENQDNFPVMNPNGWLQLVDPHTSTVTIAPGSPLGLTSCPAGDGMVFDYVVVNLKNINGDPISQVPANDITLSVEAAPGTQYFGTLSCTFTPIDTVSDANGDIRFTLQANTSIVGDITIKASVIAGGYAINNTVDLQCNSYDLNVDGAVGLSDLALFSMVYNVTYDWHADYNWDGFVDLSDFSLFGIHYNHSH